MQEQTTEDKVYKRIAELYNLRDTYSMNIQKAQQSIQYYKEEIIGINHGISELAGFFKLQPPQLPVPVKPTSKKAQINAKIEQQTLENAKQQRLKELETQQRLEAQQEAMPPTPA